MFEDAELSDCILGIGTKINIILEYQDVA